MLLAHPCRSLSPLLVMAVIVMTACGGGATGAPKTDGPAMASTTPPAEAPAPPTALVTAHFACAGSGERTLTYVVEDSPRSCDDDAVEGSLTIIHHPGAPGTAAHFEWRAGSERGEGPACTSPTPCVDAAHTLTITPGDPPRIEWTLSLGEEDGDHGSAAVLLCNDDPGPEGCR